MSAYRQVTPGTCTKYISSTEFHQAEQQSDKPKEVKEDNDFA